MNCQIVADEIARQLEHGIESLPEGFYRSFEFTQTGNNLTHPITLGLLSRIVWGLPNVRTVGIDARLNAGAGCKFQPDIVGFGEGGKPVLFIDYESPNSSDARVPVKDVEAYARWREHDAAAAPYIIVTTLPDCTANDWELRWTANDKWNADYRGRGAEVCVNPCRFWYQVYYDALDAQKVADLVLLNINGTSVRRMYPR